MYAIFETGGKQYTAKVGDVLFIEKLNANVDETVTFEKVLAVGDAAMTFGTPYVEGVTVSGKVLKNGKGKKEVSKLWKEMRAWKDKYYPETVLISEWANPQQAIPAGFNIDFYIHFGLKGYASLFFDRKTPWGKWEQSYQNCYFDKQGKGSLKEFSENYTKAYNATKNLGYIAVPSANHDYQRPNIGTRNTPDQLKVAMTFFLTMPGIPFIYYGDEIGMKFQMNLPNKEGSNERSGTRTPMQWTKGKNAGFSTSAPDKLYFPVDTENGKLTVEAQQGDQNSLLSYTRKLTALRHSAKALDNEGDWKLLNQKGQEYPMVYERTLGEEKYVVVVNPGVKAASLNISSVGGKAVSAILPVLYEPPDKHWSRWPCCRLPLSG